MSNKFNWIHYLYLNQDLIFNGIRTKEQATYHYNNIGKKEGRLFEYDIPIDFDKEFYAEVNPSLKNMPDDMLYAHYTKYGKKSAIYIGGQLPLIFGIIGKRDQWAMQQLYSDKTEYLINGVPEKYRPIGYDNIESGCYW